MSSDDKIEISTSLTCPVSICVQWLDLESLASTPCGVDARYMFVALLCMKLGKSGCVNCNVVPLLLK